MADPQNPLGPYPPEKNASPVAGISPIPAIEAAAPSSATPGVPGTESLPGDLNSGALTRQRRFRRNLILLLSFALTAFTLTSWIMVRLDASFTIDSTEPQQLVRAQLRALDRGELRPAYEMFSARYRQQFSYDAWHELVARHSRMFHAQVIRAEAPISSGAGVTLQIFLHGADDKHYRARFSLIRSGGRWWIDDVHWTEEQDARDFSRT